MWNRVYSDRSKQDISAEIIRIWISVKGYDEKTAEIYRNCYVVEKHIVFKLYKILIPKFDRLYWRLELRLYQNFKSLSCMLSEK